MVTIITEMMKSVSPKMSWKANANNTSPVVRIASQNTLWANPRTR